MNWAEKILVRSITSDLYPAGSGSNFQHLKALTNLLSLSRLRLSFEKLFKAKAQFLSFSKLWLTFSSYKGSGSIFKAFWASGLVFKLFKAQAQYLSFSRLWLLFELFKAQAKLVKLYWAFWGSGSIFKALCASVWGFWAFYGPGSVFDLFRALANFLSFSWLGLNFWHF